MNRKIWVMIIFFGALFLVSCSNTNDSTESRFSLIKTTNPTPTEINRNQDKTVAFKVKQDLDKNDEIYDSAVIEHDKKIIVAYKVRHFYRFKMKKIEKNITKQLEKAYPDEKFTVSSDYKIFLEVVRLKEELEQENISTKEAKKRFNKIINLKKEMT